jgi:hypothetical protein
MDEPIAVLDIEAFLKQRCRLLDGIGRREDPGTGTRRGGPPVAHHARQDQDARPRLQRDLAPRRRGARGCASGQRPITPDDGLDAARGIALGLAVSAVMWAVICAVWALLA